MGRLMDAILAVSALAIASAVAWANLVISCCGVGVGSESMSQVLGGQVLIMIRLKKQERGRIQKWLYLGNRQSDLLQT